VQVSMEYLLIWDLTRGIQLDDNIQDALRWKWTSDKTFSTSSAYHAFFISQQAVLGTKLWRKAQAPPKCKFFIWLVLHDWCWTAARRKRHNLQDDDSCVLCEQLPETISHLLVGCPTSRMVWFSVFRRLGWQSATPTDRTICFVDWWSHARKQRARGDRRCFDTLVILVSWLIWKERNRRTFDHHARSHEVLLTFVDDEIVSWLQAGYKQLEGYVVALGHVSIVV